MIMLPFNKLVEINFKVEDFIQLMKKKWDVAYNNTDVNLFRYKVDHLHDKLVNGKYLLKLNPSRGSNRRPPEEIVEISQPVDHNKFNFLKVSENEGLFLIETDVNEDVNALIVNVSPISKYHTLLCPSINRCLPQIVTKYSLKLVIDLFLSAQDRNLRIAFNSLCALASVNHLHFHLLLEDNTLPVENVICEHIAGSVYKFDGSYPVTAFCFYLTPAYDINDIFKLFELLLKKSIAHNVFITRGLNVNNEEGRRLIVYPRKSCAGVKQLDCFNVAACELSGWFVVYNEVIFENIQQEDLEKEMSKWKIDKFDQLCEEIEMLYK